MLQPLPLVRRAFKLLLAAALLLFTVFAGAAADPVVNFTKKDLDASYSAAKAVKIQLSSEGISAAGSGVQISGNAVRITASGTYLIQGSLPNGQLIVDAGDKDDVQLVLNGVDLTSSGAAALYVNNADKVILTLAPGTVNRIADSSASTSELAAEDVNAAVFSKDDLTINGTGTLIVSGNYRHGIVSKDDLKIVSGTIQVTTVGDGIKGRDLIAVKGGQITISAQQDGMQSNNDSDPTRGLIYIEAGTIDISAQLDGIQAAADLYIKGGAITINSASADGLKAGREIAIDGGSITIDSADDAVHADSSLTINGGQIVIERCYEGLESATIAINGGTIRIAGARDDGINAAGGVDGAAVSLIITGGYIFVSAEGDGIDCNGDITMTGGTVIVHGPTGRGNAALDYNGHFVIEGGLLVAAGSAGMAMAPSPGSSQKTIAITFNNFPAHELVHLASADDLAPIITFKSSKPYQSLVVSTPQIQADKEYVVYQGGSSTGTEADGLFIDGVYTPGTQIGTVAASQGQSR